MIRASLLLIALFSTAIAEEARTFTDTQGRTIQATIIECTSPDKVSIELTDGRTYKNVPVSTFSEKIVVISKSGAMIISIGRI